MAARDRIDADARAPWQIPVRRTSPTVATRCGLCAV